MPRASLLLEARWWALGALAAALLLPLAVQNEYYLQVIITGFIWAIAVYGLNIILGYAGQLSLGHAGFFGIGAYTVALLTADAGWAFWPALAAALVLSVIAGYLVGFICLRSRGHYFAIFTLAVGVIIHLVLQKWESLTHGHIGVIGIPKPDGIGPIDFEDSVARYYLALGFLVLAALGARNILRSLLGHSMVAVRDSEELATAVGIDSMAVKRLAFALSTAYAGVAGGLYASYIGYLGPEIASIDMTFFMLLYLLVGGAGSIAGPIIGTLAVYGMTQVLQATQEYQMLVFGPLLVALIIFFPAGLAGGLRRLRLRLNKASAEPAEEPA